MLKSTVTEWKLINPQVWILPSVDDGKGGKVDWAIEGRTPGQLVRAGWSRSILKTGDVITVDFSPAKDGTRTGLLTRVSLADGTVLGQAPPATIGCRGTNVWPLPADAPQKETCDFCDLRWNCSRPAVPYAVRLPIV